MKGWRIIISTVGLVLLLVLVAVGLSQAQGTEPQGAQAVQVALGTAFTYQAQIDVNGSPFDGNCDFQFALYDAPSDGTQIGTTQTTSNISVTNGLFTALLDFGSGAFNGDARWLEISARCPAGSGGYTTFAPRQALTPAPYALALPGLYTQQNATSPNVIGGHISNTVTAGMVGVTIGGGGGSSSPNTVSGNYSTVSGGIHNTAGGNYATIGGGMGNTTEGTSVIGGGRYNVASFDLATVSGGWENEALSEGSTVGGGGQNTASNSYSTVSGGSNHQASGFHATIGGGAGNTASNSYSTVSGGMYNSAVSGDATVGGGFKNIASGYYATVPGGSHAVASHYGQMAYASGQFADEEDSVGDAQTSVYVMRNTTTGITPTVLYLNGSNAGYYARLTLSMSRTLAFDILVVARSDAAASAGYRIQGVIENNAGTTSFIGTPIVTTLGEDVTSWNVSVLADDSYDALTIQVTGAAGTTIRWVARVHTAEVSW